MFNFQVKYNADAELLILTNAHLAAEKTYASMTASATTGIVSSVSNVSVRELVAADILTQDELGVCRLHNLDDGSAEAQVGIWGQIIRDQFCSCATEPNVEDWKRYERYDDDGVYTGSHGYACPTCKGIVQTG